MLVFHTKCIPKSSILGAKLAPKVLKNVTLKQHGIWVGFLTSFGAFWLHLGSQKWPAVGVIFTLTGPCDARGGRLDHLGVILVSISSKMKVSDILGAQILSKTRVF